MTLTMNNTLVTLHPLIQDVIALLVHNQAEITACREGMIELHYAPKHVAIRLRTTLPLPVSSLPPKR